MFTRLNEQYNTLDHVYDNIIPTNFSENLICEKTEDILYRYLPIFTTGLNFSKLIFPFLFPALITEIYRNQQKGRKPISLFLASTDSPFSNWIQGLCKGRRRWRHFNPPEQLFSPDEWRYFLFDCWSDNYKFLWLFAIFLLLPSPPTVPIHES